MLVYIIPGLKHPDIIEIIETAFDVKMYDIRYGPRTDELAKMRNAIVLYLMKYHALDVKQIATVINNHRTSIIHMIKAGHNMLDTKNEDFISLYHKLIRNHYPFPVEIDSNHHVKIKDYA